MLHILQKNLNIKSLFITYATIYCIIYNFIQYLLNLLNIMQLNFILLHYIQ